MATITTSAGERRSPADQPPDTLRIWVVPHTHWDREWYLPFEQFRIHLARFMDDLLDALETDPGLFFTLDGQAVILEDYLEIRPDQEERLRRLLASGRLAVGPSYVLPDEFLVGQESLIRNLLMGRQVCTRNGARPMAVGYAPDTFGHVAQLPQILRGFGIDSFVFWRGLGDEADRLGAVFQWQGPDGSRVLAVRLLEGYANARDLGRWTRQGGWVIDRPDLWPETAARRVAEFLDRWRETFAISGTRDVLLGNGVDHSPVQRDLPDMLAACREGLPGITFQIGSFDSYVDALRDSPGELQIHSGELLGGREACVVRSVNSTRLYLKQANEAAERSLFVAEALASLAWLYSRRGDAGTRGGGDAEMRGHGDGGMGKREEEFLTHHSSLITHHSSLSTHRYEYPRNELRHAWRELLRNHPHDSLPGCSLDEVHRDMEQRFRSAEQIARQIRREALAALAAVAAGMRPWEDNLEARSLVNVLPWPRTGVVDLELPPELQGARRVVAETPERPLPVQLAGPRGHRRALVVAEVAGFGARNVRLLKGRAADPAGAARATGSAAIENGYYRVEAAPNGTIAITDLSTGERLAGLHWFEDQADRGDEYSFCPVEGDLPWDSRGLRARIRVLAEGPLVAELEIALRARLPHRLKSGRGARSRGTVSYPLRTVVRLVSGVDRIEFRTTVVNTAEDHRLRVRFPAPGSDQFVRAEGHFALLRRTAQPVWNGQWREPPATTNHTLGAVAAGRLALISRGLPEYEAIPNEEGGVDLALTLLRCVGWLSWSDLATRPGAEDPHVPTPDAQCPGTHTFEYALSLRGEETQAALLRAAQDYRVGLVDGPAGTDLLDTLRVEGDGFAFSALKGAEEGDAVILRLYDPGESPAVARVIGRNLTVRRCRLDETAIETETLEAVPMEGGEIATLRIEKEPTRK